MVNGTPSQRMARCGLLGAIGFGVLGYSEVGSLDLAAQEGRIETPELSSPIPSNGRLGGVTMDRAGNVFVANFNASVFKVSPSGAVEMFATNFRGSSGNAIDARGDLYQASFLDHRIVRVSPSGEARDFVTDGLEGPVGLAFAPGGDLLVTNCRGNSLSRVDLSGSARAWSTHEMFDCPNGIALGPGGDAYVTSYNNGQVVRVSPDGSARAFVDIPDGPNAHIAYSSGWFYVTKIATGFVYRVSLTGDVARFAGTGVAGFDDGPAGTGTLAHPNGIAVTPDGHALILNDIKGKWRGDEPAEIVLRRILLMGPPDVRARARATRRRIRDR